MPFFVTETLCGTCEYRDGNSHCAPRTSRTRLKIARENEAMLPASYNLAAIYAQLGQKQKALDLLKRHFFQYARYEAVRLKEMIEARVDAVFASLREDQQFITRPTVNRPPRKTTRYLWPPPRKCSEGRLFANRFTWRRGRLRRLLHPGRLRPGRLPGR
jgi:hypothetical protein